MGCIKCGKAVTGNAEFCEECLVDMERNPVKPGTPVILPKRNELPTVKHTRKKALKPEAQVASLKRAVRILCVLSALLLIIAAAAIVLILYLLEVSPTPLLP